MTETETDVKIKGGTEFRKVGSGDARRDSEIDNRWWLLPPNEAAKSVTATLESWADQQRDRRDLLVRNARAYQNTTPALFGVNMGRINAFRAMRGERLSFNVTQSCADTLASKVGRNKIRPYFLSDGGDYKAQRKAKMRNRFLSGVFYETRTDRLARRALVDSIILGDGIVHVFHKFGRVKHEKVFPLELWWDEYEASQTPPTQLHRVKPMDVDKAVAFWPEKEEAIRAAYTRQKQESPYGAGDSKARIVFIRESWHLRSSPKSLDGAHFFSVDSEPLSEMEPYSWDRFPFARLSYSPRLFGHGWAQSGAEQLRPIQLEIDKLLSFVQRSLHLGGTFRWWAKAGSGVSVETINNQIGQVIISEERPELILNGLVPPEIYHQIRELKQSAYEQFGISQMAASSLKPAGIESGEGLRVYNDIGSERLSMIGMAYEDFHVDLGQLDLMTIQAMLAEQKEEKEEGEKVTYKVRVPHQGIVKEIDWKDIAIAPDEEYVLQVFPVSKLPSDPAGRQSQINELLSHGQIDPDTAKDLMDFPDLGHVLGLEEAQRHYLTKILDAMIDDGDYTTPEPAYDNIPMAYNLAKEYYARAREQEVPEARLSLLRDYIDACDAILNPAPAPAAPPDAPPPPGAPVLPEQQAPVVPPEQPAAPLTPAA